MPQFEPSPPFSLAPHDWFDLGKKLIYAIVGVTVGFATATGIPTLKEHTTSDVGVLIVTLLSALVPFCLQMAQKYLTDTSKVVKLILVALTLTLLSPCGLFAAEFMGASTGPTGSVFTDFLTSLTKDPLLLTALVPILLLLLSKVLKVDLSGLTPYITAFLNALLKPPGPPVVVPPVTPAVVPPVVPPTPVPTDPFALLMQQLLALLIHANSTGDTQLATALRAQIARLAAQTP